MSFVFVLPLLLLLLLLLMMLVIIYNCVLFADSHTIKPRLQPLQSWLQIFTHARSKVRLHTLEQRRVLLLLLLCHFAHAVNVLSQALQQLPKSVRAHVPHRCIAHFSGCNHLRKVIPKLPRLLVHAHNVTKIHRGKRARNTAGQGGLHAVHSARFR